MQTGQDIKTGFVTTWVHLKIFENTNLVTLVVENVSEIIYNKKCSQPFGRNHRPSSAGSERENFTQKQRYKQDAD